jgi:chorismate mutase
MIKSKLLGLLMIISTFAFGQIPATMTQYVQASQKCPDINCVTDRIDAIDNEIVALIGQRLAYVKRAAELQRPVIRVHDQALELLRLNRIRAQALQIGYPPSIAGTIFGTILFQSNIFEAENYGAPLNRRTDMMHEYF